MKIKTFDFHGVIVDTTLTSGNQVVTCPFCGEEEVVLASTTRLDSIDVSTVKQLEIVLASYSTIGNIGMI